MMQFLILPMKGGELAVNVERIVWVRSEVNKPRKAGAVPVETLEIAIEGDYVGETGPSYFSNIQMTMVEFKKMVEGL